MRVLFDTNVVLDHLLGRAPFARDALALMGRVERREVLGLLCATTLTTIHCLTARGLGREETRRAIGGLLKVFEIAPVTRAVLEDALASPFTDFEDAVLNESARHAGAGAIVTRNAADFKASVLIVYTPSELNAALTRERPPDAGA